METLCGLLSIHPKLIRAKSVLMGCKGNDLENPKSSVYNKAVVSAQKEYLALLALSGTNGTKIGGLKDKLDNKSLYRNDNDTKD